MNEQPALDVVLAYQDAWTSKEFEKAADLLAEYFVFESPTAGYTSAKEFMPFLARFGDRIGPGWQPIAVFGNATEALLMYQLFAPSGLALPLTADYFTVRDGKIVSEKLVFDTPSFGAAMAAGRDGG
jgi:SnoaL-like protein